MQFMTTLINEHPIGPLDGRMQANESETQTDLCGVQTGICGPNHASKGSTKNTVRFFSPNKSNANAVCHRLDHRTGRLM